MQSIEEHSFGKSVYARQQTIFGERKEAEQASRTPALAC
jgi:hypothetical protein